MSLTRAAVEAEIVSEIGPRMAFMGVPVVTDGTNPSLNGPIRKALADMGFPTAIPLVVADGDLSTFYAAGIDNPGRNAWRLNKLIELTCIRVMQTLLFATTGNDVDWKNGVDELKAHQWVDDLRKDLAAMEARAAQPYGADLPGPIMAAMTPDPLRMPNDPFDPCRTRSRPRSWPYP